MADSVAAPVREAELETDDELSALALAVADWDGDALYVPLTVEDTLEDCVEAAVPLADGDATLVGEADAVGLFDGGGLLVDEAVGDLVVVALADDESVARADVVAALDPDAVLETDDELSALALADADSDGDALYVPLTVGDTLED